MKPVFLLMLTAAALSPLAAYADWQVEPTHTSIGFEVSHLGLTNTPGIFRQFKSQVHFDDKKVEASTVSFSIDAGSIDTNSTERDNVLRGEGWFEAAKYPLIQFVSTSVRRIDDRHFVVSGDLSLHGKTQPVAFSAELTNYATNPFLKVPVVGFVGTATIKRSAFGLEQYMGAIGDDVKLSFQTELNKLQ